MKRLANPRFALLLLAPLVSAAVMLAFLFSRDRGEIASPVRGQPGPPPSVEEQLQVARDFNDFPLYWLGDTFGPHALRGVTRSEQPNPYGGAGPFGSQFTFVPQWSFFYGTCLPRGGDGGCPVPLSVQVAPLCVPAPSWFGITPDELTDFKGAKALQTAEAFYIWTGNVAVRLSGGDQGLVPDAANLLRALGNLPVPQADGQMPPPALEQCPAQVQNPLPPPPQGIEAARAFTGFPLYWLGESFARYTLTRVQHTDYIRLLSWSFAYGTWSEEGGWPVLVIVQPLCVSPAGDWQRVMQQAVFAFRGGKAEWTHEDTGELLRIWAGDVAIEIHGSAHDLIQQAAEAITPLGNVPVPGPDLPPPNLAQCKPAPWLPPP